MTYTRTFKTAMLASGRMTTLLVGIAAFAVLARVLTPSEYGTYRQAMMLFNFISPILAMGLPLALYYFLPGNVERPRGIMTENLLLLAAGGAVLALGLVAGGNILLARSFNNPSLQSALLLFAPYAVFALPVLAVTPSLMAQDQPRALTGYTVASRIVVLGMVVLPAFLWRTADASLLGASFGQAIVLIPGIWLMFRFCPPGRWRPSLGGMRDQLRYSIPLGLSGMAGAALMNVDKLIVSARTTPEIYAVYATGAMEIPLTAMITGSITAVLLPEFTLLHRAGGTEQIRKIWHRSIRRSASVLIPGFLYFFLLAPEVMRVLFSATYEESAVPFRIYLAFMPFRSIQFGPLLMSSGRTRQILINTVATLAVSLALGWMLVPRIGPNGAAVGLILAFVFCSLPHYLYQAGSVLGVPWRDLLPWKALLEVTVVSLAAAVPLLARPWLEGMQDLWILAILGVANGGLLLLIGVRRGLYSRNDLRPRSLSNAGIKDADASGRGNP